jgi:hypothetical protein
MAPEDEQVEVLGPEIDAAKAFDELAPSIADFISA